jgi:ribosomal-protein-alanine N-acetyltransferase
VSRTITPLSAFAAEPLAELHARCFPEEPWDAEALSRILALSGVIGFVAWQGDRPAGFALARDLGAECEILSIGVLPEFRRCGIGAALLDAIFDAARRLGLPSIVLEVAADNPGARALYAGMGFIAVGRRPRYYQRGAEMSDAMILRCAVTDLPRSP